MPFSLRGKGMALFTSLATCGNSLAQFLNPVILGAIGWKYYGVFLVILSLYGAIIYFVFPETKRLTAEEAATVFDKRGSDTASFDLQHPEEAKVEKQ
jgi:MFS family permease